LHDDILHRGFPRACREFIRKGPPWRSGGRAKDITGSAVIERNHGPVYLVIEFLTLVEKPVSVVDCRFDIIDEFGFVAHP